MTARLGQVCIVPPADHIASGSDELLATGRPSVQTQVKAKETLGATLPCALGNAHPRNGSVGAEMG